MQRNANMLKILKKSAFLQILLVSLQKCSPLSVPRTNFCPLAKSLNILCIECLQSFKWALKKLCIGKWFVVNNYNHLESTIRKSLNFSGFFVIRFRVHSFTFSKCKMQKCNALIFNLLQNLPLHFFAKGLKMGRFEGVFSHWNAPITTKPTSLRWVFVFSIYCCPVKLENA